MAVSHLAHELADDGHLRRHELLPVGLPLLRGPAASDLLPSSSSSSSSSSLSVLARPQLDPEHLDVQLDPLPGDAGHGVEQALLVAAFLAHVRLSRHLRRKMHLLLIFFFLML